MAGPFKPGGFFGPPTMPGRMNPAMNFGTMLAGFAQGNPLGGFQTLGRQQMLGAQMFNQWMIQELQRQQQAAILAERRRHNLAMEGQPTTAMRNLEAYMAMSPQEQAAYLRMQQPAVVVNQGSIPAGMQRVPSPDSPTGTTLIPEAGGPEDVKRMTAISALERMSDDAAELVGLVEEHGTETAGDTAKRMEVLRNRIIGGLPTLRDTGVLQPSDVIRMEEEFKDPVTMNPLKTGSMVLPSILGFQEEINNKLTDARKAYGLKDRVTKPAAEVGDSLEMLLEQLRARGYKVEEIE